MKTVAITGRSGCGKSTVAQYCRSRGFPVLDGDAVAREVTQLGSPCLPALAKAFGADILDEDGALRRGVLAQRAFATKGDARRLTDITHPEIVRRLLAGVAQARAAGAKLVFVDGAVIVGAPFEPFCDAIIVVRAPQQVLEQRIMRRDGISRQAAQARLASQLAQEKLDAAATFLLDNTGSEQALRAQARAVLENLLKEGMK
ncbi:MAG: dephospho-CoA kinase [Ruthenibacterium sp.]|nr:dephospho-CoA kinase [Oscillospiraceae bacterium]